MLVSLITLTLGANGYCIGRLVRVQAEILAALL
jgi:hypothetical protein